jgi:hypothetical protein
VLNFIEINGSVDFDQPLPPESKRQEKVFISLSYTLFQPSILVDGEEKQPINV